jgi:hypothetical protein
VGGVGHCTEALPALCRHRRHGRIPGRARPIQIQVDGIRPSCNPYFVFCISMVAYPVGRGPVRRVGYTGALECRP